MSITYRVAFVSLLALCLASCSGDSEPDKVGQSAAGDGKKSTNFDDLETPAASSPVDQVADNAKPEAPVADQSTPGAPIGDPFAATDQTSNSEAAPAEKAELGEKAETAAEEAKEPLPPRESLAGRWEFLICTARYDILGMLLDVEANGDEYTVKIADDTPPMPGWKIDSAKLSQKSASIRFINHQGEPVDFQGELQDDGVVRGNVQFGEADVELVRWAATEQESLDEADLQVTPVGIEKLEGFQPTEANLFVELREKARELVPASMAYQMAQGLAGAYRARRPAEDQFTEFPAVYLATAAPWGERVTNKVQLDLAYTMALCGYSPSEARKHLAAAEEKLGPEAPPAIRQRIAIARGLIFMRSDDAQEQQQGLEALEQVHTEAPFNTDATLGLADYFEHHDQPEKALDLYAELAALPTGAGDMGPVVKLWKELGRDPQDLDAFLDKIYASRVHEFAAASSDAPRAEGPQQVVLGELFTGAMCPPCVAADVATGALEVTYPQTEFVMLRYHMHVPGPDSLAIEASDERGGRYYRIQGTPSLFFNGQPIQVMGMAGPYANAPVGYVELREIVDQLLTQSSDLVIDLDATAQDGVINISADVTGVEEFPPTWRLRLCLAEDKIAFAARNGIRLHEMVVRSMPGGADGIEPEEGHLRYTGTISLDEVRGEITKYIEQITDLPLPTMELTTLHVVAFVQNDANRRVMQARSVPVTGLTPGDAASKPADAADESTPEPPKKTEEATPAPEEKPAS